MLNVGASGFDFPCGLIFEGSDYSLGFKACFGCDFSVSNFWVNSFDYYVEVLICGGVGGDWCEGSICYGRFF